MNVWVVDDDDDLREIIGDLLSECGHRVTMVRDGAAALAGLESAATVPDAILLDWMMPRVNGLEFRRRQREDPRLAGIPVVLMTATTEARIPLDEIAPDALLRKPVLLDDLLRVLARFEHERRIDVH